MNQVLIGLLAALVSTFWIWFGSPVIPIGALIVLLAKDVRKLGNARWAIIGAGCLAGFFGQGLRCGKIGDGVVLIGAHIGHQVMGVGQRGAGRTMLTIDTLFQPGTPQAAQPGDDDRVIHINQLGLGEEQVFANERVTLPGEVTRLLGESKSADAYVTTFAYEFSTSAQARSAFDAIEADAELDGFDLSFNARKRQSGAGAQSNLIFVEGKIAYLIRQRGAQVHIVSVVGKGFATPVDARNRILAQLATLTR